MVFSAFALLMFAGFSGLSAYETNSFYITELVRAKLGIPFLIIFAFFGIMSGFNLSVSYLNAFIHMMPKFYRDFNIRAKFNQKKFMEILFAISVGISIFSGYSAGFFNSFVIIAGIISFVYIIIHIVSNISLIKLFKRKKFFIPALSSIILIIAFLLSFSGNTGYFVVINYALIVSVLISVFVVLLVRKAEPRFYKAIQFEYYGKIDSLTKSKKHSK